MSTRCSIIIKDGDESHILYGSGDGYPDCAGVIIKDILKNLPDRSSGDDVATKIVQYHYTQLGFTIYPFEVASSIHQDIEYLYIIDIPNRWLDCYATGWLIGEKMTEDMIVEMCETAMIPDKER